MDRGLVGEKGIRAAVDDERSAPIGIGYVLGRQLAPKAPVLLDQHEADVVAGIGRSADLVGGSKSGNSAADDDDALHVSAPHMVVDTGEILEFCREREPIAR